MFAVSLVYWCFIALRGNDTLLLYDFFCCLIESRCSGLTIPVELHQTPRRRPDVLASEGSVLQVSAQRGQRHLRESAAL